MTSKNIFYKIALLTYETPSTIFIFFSNAPPPRISFSLLAATAVEA